MEILRLAIAGLPAGGMYALAALGIVLIYRATGTLNFAQGAVATASAFVFHWAWVEQGVPLPLAIGLAVGLAIVLGLVLGRLVQAVGAENVLAQVILTLGVQGVIVYVCGEIFGLEARVVPAYFPRSGFELAGVFISYEQLAVVSIAGVLAGLLGLLLVRTGLGTAVRAVSQNRMAANLAGLPVPRLQALSWTCGSALAGLAGVLLAPLLFVDTTRLNIFFLVKPFAAAVVGGLSSLPVTFGAGLAIGAVEGALTRYNILPGLTETVPFVIMLLALVVRRSFHVAGGSASLTKAPSPRPGLGRPWIGVSALAALAVVVPSLGPSQTVTFRLVLCFSLLALSLVVLTGWVGQVSLAQGAFFGLGAFIAATLGNRAGLPFPLVLVIAPLAVVPFALVVGLPAVRFRGFLLTVVTLGFSALCSASLFQWKTLTGGLDGSHFPRPDLFGFDLAPGQRFTYLCLVLTGLVFAAVRNLARYRAGGTLFAVRESEEGAAALAMNVAYTKLLAFGLSGAIAGLGGALFGYTLGFVSAEQFSPLLSATMLAVTMVVGIESLWGAALAGVLYALPSGPTVQLLSSLAVIVVLIVAPGGLTQLPKRLLLLIRRERQPRTALAPFGPAGVR